MPAEEIIKEIRKQEEIINEAQRKKAALYDELLGADFNLVSVKEAARLLNVSIPTVYNMINSGELEAKRIGGVIRINKANMRKYSFTNMRK